MPAQLLFKKKRMLFIDKEARKILIKNNEVVEEAIDVNEIQNVVHNAEKLTIIYKDNKRKSLGFSFPEKQDIKSFVRGVNKL